MARGAMKLGRRKIGGSLVHWYRAVALDLDGTLTTGGWPAPAVLDAIAAVREKGVRVLLVTGRILSDLDVEFPGLANRFDLVVAENGCVLRGANGSRLLADPVEPALLERLHDVGIGVSRGQVLLATAADAGHIALDAIESLGLDVHLVRNRGALMLMPAGITKGTGLREGLAELGISPHNSLAVGDAENDYALLGAAELGVAVGNAVKSLREHADLVLTAEDGAGVADLLTGPVLDGRQRIHSTRWQLVLGQDMSRRPAVMPASQTNLLITGDTESGKSYLAGLVIEQLLALGYVLLVVDPEGDHVPLGALRGVTVLGSSHLPHPAELPALYGHGAACVIVDLSGMDPSARDNYLAGLRPAVARYRTQTGQPHWIVMEEAQNLLCCRTTGLDSDLAAMRGLCLISYQPQQLATPLLAGVEWHVALSPGSRTAILSPPEGQPYPFTVGSRTTGHVRHWHKYVDGVLPPNLRFAFHGDNPADILVATNLREFIADLPKVPATAISFHALRADFSRWISDAYRDHILAGLVATTERDLIDHGDAERTRRLLITLVAFRYLPLGEQ